jgi:uncharacterized protein YdeI (YjbR/CyaY-like superfamily)
MKLRYFKSAAAFRAWLEVHHQTATELWVGFYKKASGRIGLSYDEAVEEALCFGWIDGIKKRVDNLSYTHRFTPRKPRSVWSRVNIARVARLNRAGRMMPAGLKAYAAREAKRSSIYSFKNASRTLSPGEEELFQAASAAWSFFQQQPPGYRRLVVWWISSAKKPETRARRLGQLIHDSHEGRRLRQVTGKQ